MRLTLVACMLSTGLIASRVNRTLLTILCSYLFLKADFSAGFWQLSFFCPVRNFFADSVSGSLALTAIKQIKDLKRNHGAVRPYHVHARFFKARISKFCASINCTINTRNTLR